jgi:hypothetical protein
MIRNPRPARKRCQPTQLTTKTAQEDHSPMTTGVGAGDSPKPPKPVRKRKPPTQLVISEESKAALEARLKSEDGRRCIDQFVTLIVEWAVAQMPTDLLEALVKEKGHATLKEIWPDIVNAYFKALSNPRPRK